jgi:hypothetical protein
VAESREVSGNSRNVSDHLHLVSVELFTIDDRLAIYSMQFPSVLSSHKLDPDSRSRHTLVSTLSARTMEP